MKGKTMNKKRREAISKLVSALEAIKADIETLQSEEQDAYDNMPEGLQQGERGTAVEEAANQLQEAADGVDTVIDALNEAKGEE